MCYDTHLEDLEATGRNNLSSYSKEMSYNSVILFPSIYITPKLSNKNNS